MVVPTSKLAQRLYSHELIRYATVQTFTIGPSRTIDRGDCEQKKFESKIGVGKELIQEGEG